MVNLQELYSFVSKFIDGKSENIDTLQLYFGAFFQAKGIENSEYTKYLLNLDREDIKPFDELLSRLGYSSDKNTNTSDISDGFVEVISGIAALQVAKEISIELEKIDCTDISDLIKDIEVIKGLNNGMPKSWGAELLPFYLSSKDIGNITAILDINSSSDVSETETFDLLKGVLNYIQIKQTETVYTEEVKQAVDNLMQRIEVLYDRLWGNSYIGIILPTGEIKYSKGTKHRGKERLIDSLSVYTQSLARAWYAEAQITSDRVAPDGVMLNLDYDVVPDLHLGYLTSRTEWVKKYKPTLKGKLLRQLSSIPKEGYSAFVTQLYKTLTSCMFLVDVNNHTMQLRASYIRKGEELKTEMLEILTTNATNAQECNILTTVLNSSKETSDILSLTCIYNMTYFEKEILFAHKLYTGPNPVETKLTETVLGVKFDGSYAKTNLFANRFISIVAGSRSGKGTLTMSLLASLLASGEGVVYLDNKPDIASLFWNMERNMKSKGKDVKFLAIDSAGQKSEFDKSVGERIIKDSDGNVSNIMNVPKGINSNLLLPIRTYKTLQLAMLLGRIRPKDLEMDKGNTFIFIDEATLLTQAIEKMYIELDSGIKGRKTNETLANYCDKVVDFISEVHQAFADISLKQGEENLTFVTIGQCLDGLAPKDWRVASGPTLPKIDAPKKNLFFSILGSTQFWLSGREQVSSRCYELSPEEYTMANKTGSFIGHYGKPSSSKFNGSAGIYSFSGAQGGPAITTENSTLFRSYFALVNNDYQKSLVENAVASGFDDLNRLLSENKNNGFTYNFLNNVLNNNISNLQDGSFKSAMDELYDNGLLEGVGFEGLIQSIVSLKGLPEDDYIAGLNTGYNRFNRIFEKTNMRERFGYSCLEEYLYDCSPDSLFTNSEILDMYFGVYTPKSKTNSDIDLGIDFENSIIDTEVDDVSSKNSFAGKQVFSTFEDGDKQQTTDGDTETPVNEDSAETPINEGSSSFFDTKVKGSKSNSDKSHTNQTHKPIRDVESEPVSHATKDIQALRPHINLPKAPFRKNKDGMLTNLMNLSAMSSILLDNISQTFGGLQAVESFRVNANGTFSINDTTYMPTFPDSFYFGLPLAIQQKVNNGSLVELFNFNSVYRLKNLQSFEVENQALGQGRCRLELGVPRNKRYSWLFKKFADLMYINIAGVEYRQDTPDTVDADSYTDNAVGIGSRIANVLGLGRNNRGEKTSIPNPISDSRTNDLWESRPVRVLTNAFGWTVGVKAITLAATLFGPWGLLFGALAAAGTYNELKQDNSRNTSDSYNTQSRNTDRPRVSNNSNKSKKYTQSKQNNKSNNNDKHNDNYK